jgi:hypothetical protein
MISGQIAPRLNAIVPQNPACDGARKFKAHNAVCYCILASLRQSSQKRNRLPNAPPKSRTPAFFHATYERAE